MGSAGTEFGDGSAPGHTHHPGCLGGDEGLVVQRQQDVGFNQLCFDGGSADGENGFPGEDDGAFRYSPHVAGEAECGQIIQECFVKDPFAPEECYIGRRKVQVFDIPHDLFQPRRHSIPAAVRYLPVEHIKIGNIVLQRGIEIPSAHGQLIEVAEQGKAVFVVFHGDSLLEKCRIQNAEFRISAV